jgi:branched-chain amino acid transport system substrate-binding protein
VSNLIKNNQTKGQLTRRSLLQSAMWMSGAVATGLGSWVFPAKWSHAAGPIKVGIATDLTGAISFGGIPCSRIAKLAIDQINADGGLLGRPLEMYLEDTASNEQIAVGVVRKLVQRERVDVVLGGITSSMRNAIKGIIVGRGRTLYIYPQLYEGRECTPYLFNTGPTPAQQCDKLIPWLIANGGKRFALPSANYVWPHVLNEYARKSIEENGGEVVMEEYYPLDQVEYGATVKRIMDEKIDVVFNTVIPPGLGPFIKQLYEAGFLKRGGRLSCVYYDENALNFNTPQEMEGLASCLDYFQNIEDPFSSELQAAYQKRHAHKDKVLFSAGSGSTGMYRGVKLWEAAVKEAGAVDRDSVAAAMDHAKIANGPGGPSEMLPGTYHCQMNMYIAVAKGGKYEIVSKADQVDPKECG